MPLTNWINNKKIGTKLALGFGSVLTFVAINIASNNYSMMNIDNVFTEYRGTARASNEVSQVQGNLLSARLALKNYLQTPTDETGGLVNDRIDTTRSYIESAAGFVTDEAQISVLRNVEANLNDYADAFTQTRAYIAERDRVVNDGLNVVGPQIERNFTEIMKSAYEDGDAASAYDAGIALRSLLLGRLYTNRFLVDNLEPSYERAVTELTQLQADTATMLSNLENPVRRDLAQNAIDLQVDYKALLQEVHTAITSRNDLITNALDQIGPSIAVQTEDLKLALKDRQDTLGPNAVSIIDQSVLTSGVLAAFTLLFGIAAAIVIGRLTSRPIAGLTKVMDSLAEGERQLQVPALGQSDEVGVMARSVEMFREKLIENDQLQADADRQAEERSQRAERVRQLSNDFDSNVTSIMSTVSGAVSELGDTANVMNVAAAEAQNQTTTVASAAEQATGNVETVAAAAEELSSSISEISRQVSQSTTLANQAVEESEDTNQRIKTLQGAVNDISQVVDLITDIAEQTNLLALNATIEAARAGEAGKGFAVVASEVKNLSHQTTKATEQILSQIQDVQGSTTDAVASIGSISERITEMSGITSTIAAAVEEQNAATQEIARNVQEAAIGTRSVTESVVKVSQTANETGAASEQVNNLSGNLRDESGRLKTTVETFLSEVKAA